MPSVPTTQCVAEGCSRPPVARGYCDKHRRHIKRHGRIIDTWRGHAGCRVGGCEGTHYAYGYCRRHYRHVQRHGTPCPPSIRERLSQGSERHGSCLLWTGSRYPNGYGRIGYQGRDRMAHRLAYELHHGPIPDGLYVCHHCDTPNCIEPSHLFVGTQADNLDDMRRKGRWAARDRRGESNARAKTTETEVRIVKRLRQNTDLTCPVIADCVGLPLGIVEAISAGRTWKHVQP